MRKVEYHKSRDLTNIFEYFSRIRKIWLCDSGIFMYILRKVLFSQVFYE